jgi:hypothetical protein
MTTLVPKPTAKPATANSTANMAFLSSGNAGKLAFKDNRYHISSLIKELLI